MIVLGVKQYNTRQEVLSELAQASVVAVDTETENLDDQSLLGAAISTGPNLGVYFDFTKDDDIADAKRLLSRLPSVYHNAMFDLPLLNEQLGVVCPIIDDSMFLAQSQGYPGSLENLSAVFDFNYTPAYTFLSNKKAKLSATSVNIVGKMCAEHAIGTYKVWDALHANATKSYHIDMELLPVLMRMYREGIAIDCAAAKHRYDELEHTVTGLKDTCELMGYNPASTKQVGKRLSEEGFYLGLTRKRTQMRTDDEALQSILDSSMTARLVLAFRHHSKLLGTYIKPFLETPRVYPRYRIVSTGRLAASNPNAQNFPKPERVIFIPDDGDIWWDADMKQIEPKVMAYISQDPQMLTDAFSADFYQPTADAFGIDRQVSKTLLLASSYGAQPQILASKSNMTVEDMEYLLARYYQRYPVFDQWRRQVMAGARSTGYVTTWYGRRRSLVDEYIHNPHEADKEAVNTIIQGTAADILKMAMVNLVGYKQRLTVHDEVVVSCKADACPSVSMIDNVTEFPLVWTVKTGNNWRDVA